MTDAANSVSVQTATICIPASNRITEQTIRITIAKNAYFPVSVELLATFFLSRINNPASKMSRSRLMIALASQTGNSRKRISSMIRTAANILSASGSRISPSLLIRFIRRATYPSNA